MIQAVETDEGCYTLDAEWTVDELTYAWPHPTKRLDSWSQGESYFYLRGELIGLLFVWNDTEMEAEVGHPCPFIVIDNEKIHLSELNEQQIGGMKQ